MWKKQGGSSGWSVWGVIDSTKSTTVGCTLDAGSTQWFDLDGLSADSPVYLCWIAGLSDGTHTLTVSTGSDSDAWLGVSVLREEASPPKGGKRDGQTF